MNDVYETSKLVDEYLLFHYGREKEILPAEIGWPEGMKAALGFAERTVKWFTPGEKARGLDLGCAVGRSTFEMSRQCARVTGIDFSHAFIAAADALRQGMEVPYQRLDEGHLKSTLIARAPFAADGLDFLQGDAMALPEELGSFDRVHAANLLCRLPEPLRLLGRLPSLVAEGGELVLATPCTWLEEFTPPANWPESDTFGWLEHHLGGSFGLVRRGEEPFLIRETARKFQWTRSMVTVWVRLADG